MKYMDIHGDRIEVVPNGVDCEKYSKQTDLNKIDVVKNKYGIDGEYILYMGTLEPRKNIGLLIEAYHILTGDNSDLLKLVIAGKRDGCTNIYFRWFRSLG